MRRRVLIGLSLAVAGIASLSAPASACFWDGCGRSSYYAPTYYYVPAPAYGYYPAPAAYGYYPPAPAYAYAPAPAYAYYAPAPAYGYYPPAPVYGYYPPVQAYGYYAPPVPAYRYQRAYYYRSGYGYRW